MGLLKKYRPELNFLPFQEDYINFELLREDYPTVLDCQIAIAELRGLLELPKGTTYYFSDIHGQGDKFRHILHNKAGVIRRKIDEILPNLEDDEKTDLMKICFYPSAAIRFFRKKIDIKSKYYEFIERNILFISRLIQHTGSKTTRKSFREKINIGKYRSIIQEFATASNMDKIDSKNELYQKTIIKSFFDSDLEIELIAEMVLVLKQLLVYKYVINGDIPDRGRDTAEIIDALENYYNNYKNVEINWGNHDLLWMGAAAGSRELICEFIRIQIRYAFEAILEDDYGIDLKPLADFADRTYPGRPGAGFSVRNFRREISGKYSELTLMKMQKTVAVLLWKLETIRYRELNVEPCLDNLKFDGKINYCKNAKEYILNDQDFPTIDPLHPSQMTDEESVLLDYLYFQVKKSVRFQHQMRFMANVGSLYHYEDNILSYHAIVPLNDDGTLKRLNILGELYSGRELFDVLTSLYKGAFTTQKPPQKILDLFYTGWKGADSWTYGKSSMETFTRTLVDDKETHRERKSVYYEIMADEKLGMTAVDNIIENFVGEDHGHRIKIFNGHVPVNLEKGDRAVKADGRIICGDGGFSEAYGDLGFALISTSKGLYLNKLGPSVSEEEVVGEQSRDIIPEILWQEKYTERLRLKDSSFRLMLEEKIKVLMKLIERYNTSISS